MNCDSRASSQQETFKACCEPHAGSVVEWAVSFGINKPGVTLQWAFAFAAYEEFTKDLQSLDASPVETSSAAAGTPGVGTYNEYLLKVSTL